MIVWFEHIPKSKQPSSLSYGGYKDPQNTDWMYADTLICETGLASKTYEEVLEYIKGVMREYSSHEMVPTFYLEIEKVT